MQTSGKNDLAFEVLMKEVPNNDHYDSGESGVCPECKSCRFHRPEWSDRSCVFRECPYQPGLKTSNRTVKKAGRQKGGAAGKNAKTESCTKGR